MPKVKILKDTVAGGKRVAAGKVVELTEDDANLLVRAGKATKDLGGKPAKTEKGDEDKKPAGGSVGDEDKKVLV